MMQNNLRQLLQERNMTQKDLANMTGIPESNISRYITGDVLASKYLLLMSIAKALNVEISDIIKED